MSSVMPGETMNRLRLQGIINNVGYKPETSWRITTNGGHGWFVQHQQNIADCSTGDPGTIQRGRKFYISPYMTESEVLQTLLLAVLLFEEHEAREWFTYRGKELYGPHIDISQKDAR